MNRPHPTWHFAGVGLLVSWGINVLGLIVADGLFDGMTVRRWGPLVLAGAVLGLANTVLRPLVAVLALPFVLLTFGLGLFAVNVLMLAFTEWVTPDFSVDGFWTYVGATAVVGVVNLGLGSLLGRRKQTFRKVTVRRNR
ncbi:MAG: phage holin family protein [Gaiella sp.]